MHENPLNRDRLEEVQEGIRKGRSENFLGPGRERTGEILVRVFGIRREGKEKVLGA
jgi:hypothetical protein